MVWISFLFMIFSLHAAELPRFLTKHSPETLRYISMDGRFAYVQKRPGVLGLVSSFRSLDFLSEANSNEFLVKASGNKGRLAIESIPHSHDEMNLLKNHSIYVVDYGNTATRLVGVGRNARLHLKDEWISYYNMTDKVIHIINLITQKKFEIKLSRKANPFFIPEVQMISARSIAYTDINEAGYAALISYDLENLKSTIAYRSTQTGTRLELCQSEGYLGLGEFPYDGISRGSIISTMPTSDSMNLAGFIAIYNSVDQDIGNMVCLPGSIYFVKTMNLDKELNFKVTEAVNLDLKTQNLEVRSSLKSVVQLIEMDRRVMIPFRGDFFVLEGNSNLGEDLLKGSRSKKEELQIDI
jgi:hypothetical protein